MHKNRITPLLVILILSACTLKAHAQSKETEHETIALTFSDAFNLVLNNNSSIKQAKAKISQTERDVKAAKGYFAPQISLSASAVALSEDLTLDLTPVRDAITPLYEVLGNYGTFSGVPNPDPNTQGAMPILPDNISTQAVRGNLNAGLEKINGGEWDKMIQEKHFATLSAGFTMPIYAGGKIRTANKAASIKNKTAISELENTIGVLSIELTSRYYGHILASQAYAVRLQVEQTMLDHANDAEKLMNEGLISRAEYLHAKVTHAEASRELSKAKLQVELANEALKNTLNIDGKEVIEPVSPLFFNDSIENLSYFISKAKTCNALLKKVEITQDLVHQGYRMEFAELMPEIAAMGTYELANKNLSPYMPEYMVGVGLKWNIFNGGRNYQNVKSAKLKETQAEYFGDKAEADIILAITNAYKELNVSKSQLVELEEANTFAEEYSRVQQKAFSEGLSTSTEVSQANLALAKVHIEKLQALYHYDVALSKLLYFAGIPEELSRYAVQQHTLNTESLSENAY